MEQKLPLALQYFDIENELRDLPRGERWLRHLKEDLLPFWEMPTALGEPIGNFPTYRNNDGSLVDWENPRPEFQHVVDGIIFLIETMYGRSRGSVSHTVWLIT